MYLGGGAEAKIELFRNMVRLHIKLKGTVRMKVVMLHINLKGKERRSPRNH